MTIKYIESSSSGISLRFHTKTEKDAYDKEVHNITMKYYHKEVQEHGIFASNQNCYVTTPDYFNLWDSEVTYNAYLKWYEETYESN